MTMPERQEKRSAQKGDWLKIEISSPAETIDALNNFLEEIGAQGGFQEYLEDQSQNGFSQPASAETIKAFLPFDARTEKRVASLQMYLHSLAELFPELEKPKMTTEVIHDPGWEEEWKKYFKPIRVSHSIVVKPTWERCTQTGGDIVIDIDPGMAFGTGQHPSTRMCIEAMEDILLHDRSRTNWQVLDAGTGTGILGIAAAKLNAERVLCVDTDKKAVEIATQNVLINNVQKRVGVRQGEITALSEPFDLIVSNINAKTMIKLRSHLTRLLNSNGYLIISGIIEQEKNDIAEHFPADSYPIHRFLQEKEWICFVMRKGNPSK
jgi:ribosomal protein L11 methyltransferase